MTPRDLFAFLQTWLLLLLRLWRNQGFFLHPCYFVINCLLVINVVFKTAAVRDDLDINQNLLQLKGKHVRWDYRWTHPTWNATWRGAHPPPRGPVCSLPTGDDNAGRASCSAVRSITAAVCLPLDIFIPYANPDPVEPVIIHQEVSPNGNCFCPAHSLFIRLDGSGGERLHSKQTVSPVLLFISLSLRIGMRQSSGAGLFNSPLSSFHLFLLFQW